MKTTFLLTLLLIIPCAIRAQLHWTLDSCLHYLMENHLSLGLQKLAIQEARIGQSIAQQSMFPKIEFLANGGWQLGRTIDPTTNGFHNQSIGFVSSSLNVRYDIFNGGHRRATLDRQEAQLNSEQASFYHQSWVLKRQLIPLFFEVLKAKEFLHLSEMQVEYQQFQSDYLALLINQGVKSANERIPFQTAQIEKERQLTQAKISYESALQALKRLLQIPFDQHLELVVPGFLNGDPNFWEKPLLQTAGHLIEVILQRSAAIADLESQQKQFEAEVRMLASAYRPNLSILASIHSNYSSASKQVAYFDKVMMAQEVLWDGQSTFLELPIDQPVYRSTPFWRQWRNHFGQQIGLQFRLPLWNGGLQRLQQSKLQVKKRQLKTEEEKIRISLKQDIQQFLTAIEQTRKLYRLSMSQTKTLRVAANLAKQSYDLGAIKSYDFLQAISELHLSEQQQLQNKYELIFQMQLLEFYYSGRWD